MDRRSVDWMLCRRGGLEYVLANCGKRGREYAAARMVALVYDRLGVDAPNDHFISEDEQEALVVAVVRGSPGISEENLIADAGALVRWGNGSRVAVRALDGLIEGKLAVASITNGEPALIIVPPELPSRSVTPPASAHQGSRPA